MISRIKIMGNIDISEKRRPQDGRIKMTMKNKHFDLRVSALPTSHGQSMVMRVLDSSAQLADLSQVGMRFRLAGGSTPASGAHSTSCGRGPVSCSRSSPSSPS